MQQRFSDIFFDHCWVEGKLPHANQCAGTKSSRVESSLLARRQPLRAQGNNETESNFNSHYFGVESSIISQKFVCIAVAVHFPKFAMGSTFIFAHPMCLLVFQSLSCVLQSTLGHVSTNGCLKGWQCTLLISNVVPRCGTHQHK